MGPSRADEDRNWGASKKFVPTQPPERRGGAPDREREPAYDGPSRADGDRNWGASKAFVPSAPEERGASRFAPPRSGGFGGERREEVEGDRWARREAPDEPSERPRLQLKQRSADAPLAAPAAEAKPSIFGGATPVAVRELTADAEPVRAPPARPSGPDEGRWERRAAPPADAAPARPSERPKLQLAPRAATAPPPADAAAAPTSLAERGGKAASVFGDARPRELKLAEEGRDWRVEDAKVAARSGGAREETPAEAALRAELALSQAAAAAEGASDEAKAAAVALELRLAAMVLAEDDKRRFATTGKGPEGGWRKEVRT
jgi:hypothetical protein